MATPLTTSIVYDVKNVPAYKSPRSGCNEPSPGSERELPLSEKNEINSDALDIYREAFRAIVDNISGLPLLKVVVNYTVKFRTLLQSLSFCELFKNSDVEQQQNLFLRLLQRLFEEDAASLDINSMKILLETTCEIVCTLISFMESNASKTFAMQDGQIIVCAKTIFEDKKRRSITQILNVSIEFYRRVSGVLLSQENRLYRIIELDDGLLFTFYDVMLERLLICGVFEYVNQFVREFRTTHLLGIILKEILPLFISADGKNTAANVRIFQNYLQNHVITHDEMKANDFVICTKLLSMSDEHLKLEDNGCLETILHWSAIVCTALFPEVNFIDRHIAFIYKCFKSSNLGKRLFAVKLATKYCTLSQNEIHLIYIPREKFAKKIMEAKLLALLCCKRMHTQILKKSYELVFFLAICDMIKTEHLSMIWRSIDGKNEDESKVMYRILHASLHCKRADCSITFNLKHLEYVFDDLVFETGQKRLERNDFQTFVINCKNSMLEFEMEGAAGRQCHSKFVQIIWNLVKLNLPKLGKLACVSLVQLIEGNCVEQQEADELMKMILYSIQHRGIKIRNGVDILIALILKNAKRVYGGEIVSKKEKNARHYIIKRLDQKYQIFQILFSGLSSIGRNAKKYDPSDANAYLHALFNLVRLSRFSFSSDDLKHIWDSLVSKDLDRVMMYFKTFALVPGVFLRSAHVETISTFFDNVFCNFPSHMFTPKIFEGFEIFLFCRNEIKLNIESFIMLENNKHTYRPSFLNGCALDLVGMNKLWDILLTHENAEIKKRAKQVIIDLCECPCSVKSVTVRQKLLATVFSAMDFSGKAFLNRKCSFKNERCLDLLVDYIMETEKKFCSRRYVHGLFHLSKTLMARVYLVCNQNWKDVPFVDICVYNFEPAESLAKKALNQFQDNYKIVKTPVMIVLKKTDESVIPKDRIVEEFIEEPPNTDEGGVFLHISYVEKTRQSFCDLGHADSKLQTNFICHNTEDRSQNNTADTDVAYVGSKHVESISHELPGKIISTGVYFRSLYTLLNCPMENIVSKVWQLIMNIPTGSQVIDYLQHPKKIFWGVYLRKLSPPQRLYVTQIVWQLLWAPANNPVVPPFLQNRHGELDKLAFTAWKRDFIDSGGLRSLEELFLECQDDCDESFEFNKNFLCLASRIFLIYLCPRYEDVGAKERLYNDSRLRTLGVCLIDIVNRHGLEVDVSHSSIELCIASAQCLTRIISVSEVFCRAIYGGQYEHRFIKLLSTLRSGNSSSLRSEISRSLCELAGQLQDLHVTRLISVLVVQIDLIDPKSLVCLEYFRCLVSLRSIGPQSNYGKAIERVLCKLQLFGVDVFSPIFLHGILLFVDSYITVKFDKPMNDLVCDSVCANALVQCLLALSLNARNESNICGNTKCSPLAYNIIYRVWKSKQINLKEKLLLFEVFKTRIPNLPPKTGWKYSVEDEKLGNPGFLGLYNQGLTCYINALMQQLFMNDKFRNGILSTAYISSDDAHGKKYGLQLSVLLFELKKMFVFMNHCYCKAYDPKGFVNACRDNPPGFFSLDSSVFDQNDACEFFCIFSDKIEHALKIAGVHRLKASANEEEHEGEYTNLVRDCFVGEFSHQIILLDDDGKQNRIKERTEPFYHIQLTIKNQNNVTDSLENFILDELMEGDNAFLDETLNLKVRAIKRVRIKSLPPTLILHLKRFEINYDTFEKVKLNDYFSFPFELDMKPYMTKEEVETCTKFRLCGVIVHSGTANGGHYYSYARDRSSENNWYEFNDEVVERFDVSRLGEECYGGFVHHPCNSGQEGSQKHHNNIPIEKNAFMLFYERLESSASDETRPLRKRRKLLDGRMHIGDRKDLQFTVTMHDSRITTQIFKELDHCNSEFWNTRSLFDEGLVYFFTKSLNGSPRCVKMVDLFQIALKLFFNIRVFARRTTNAQLEEDFAKALANTLRDDHDSRTFFLYWLVEDTKRLRYYLLKCPTSTFRKLTVLLIVTALVSQVAENSFAFDSGDCLDIGVGDTATINLVDAPFNVEDGIEESDDEDSDFTSANSDDDDWSDEDDVMNHCEKKVVQSGSPVGTAPTGSTRSQPGTINWRVSDCNLMESEVEDYNKCIDSRNVTKARDYNRLSDSAPSSSDTEPGHLCPNYPSHTCSVLELDDSASDGTIEDGENGCENINPIDTKDVTNLQDCNHLNDSAPSNSETESDDNPRPKCPSHTCGAHELDDSASDGTSADDENCSMEILCAKPEVNEKHTNCKNFTQFISTELLRLRKKTRSLVGNVLIAYISLLEDASYDWRHFEEFFTGLVKILRASDIPVKKRQILYNIMHSQHALARCINVVLNEDSPNYLFRATEDQLGKGTSHPYVRVNLPHIRAMESISCNDEANLSGVYALISTLSGTFVCNEFFKCVNIPVYAVRWMKCAEFIKNATGFVIVQVMSLLTRENSVELQNDFALTLLIKLVYNNIDNFRIVMTELFASFEQPCKLLAIYASLKILWILISETTALSLRFKSQIDMIIYGFANSKHSKKCSFLEYMVQYHNVATSPSKSEETRFLTYILEVMVKIGSFIATNSEYARKCFIKAALEESGYILFLRMMGVHIYT